MIGLIVFVLILGLWAGITYVIALGAQYVLAAFGIHVSVWVCWLILFVLRYVIGAARGASKS